jgi:hypothetical protein
MPFKDTYLGILRRRNKPMFRAVAVFMSVTLLINATRNEITPFFVWAMYAGKSAEVDTFPVFVLQYNDGKVFHAPHTWKDHKRMMFFYTIDHYTLLRDNDYTDPDMQKAGSIMGKAGMSGMPLGELYTDRAAMQQYPAWLMRYMQANLGEHIDSISVYRKWMRYGKDGRVTTARSELLFKAQNQGA